MPSYAVTVHRGADMSIAQPTSRCILFDGENISFDASLVIYVCVYIYVCVCICICVCIYMCVCIYIYICVCVCVFPYYTGNVQRSLLNPHTSVRLCKEHCEVRTGLLYIT